MMTSQTETGGFVGDPAEAFTPSAAGGCCGETISVSTVTACCGTVEAAQNEGSCCGSAAKADAVATGAGCCG